MSLLLEVVLILMNEEATPTHGQTSSESRVHT